MWTENRPHSFYKKIDNEKSWLLHMCYWHPWQHFCNYWRALSVLSTDDMSSMLKSTGKSQISVNVFRKLPFHEIEDVSWEIPQISWPTCVLRLCQTAILGSVSQMYQGLVKMGQKYLGNCSSCSSYTPTNANRFSSCSLFASIHTLTSVKGNWIWLRFRCEPARNVWTPDFWDFDKCADLTLGFLHK